MSDFFDKISSYNIFNYLLPGTLFALIGDSYSSYRLVQDDLLIGVFAYYFMGLVISRVGSLLIEPTLKKVGFLNFAEYSKFVTASMVDKKLDELSEANNMYRTLCSLFLFLLALLALDSVIAAFPTLKTSAHYLVFTGLFVLFVFSYRKQTNYITRRVNSATDDK